MCPPLAMAKCPLRLHSTSFRLTRSPRAPFPYSAFPIPTIPYFHRTVFFRSPRCARS
ncbi:wd repeat-containing protein 46 [Moniliophthora roreri]|nr:wd repeat-containing protein 46 [Moniliophthora roreri]